MMYLPAFEVTQAIRGNTVIQLRTLVLGSVLACAVTFAAIAEDEKAPQTDQADQNFSLDEAADNFVEDAGKVGDKAEEVGDDAAEGAEDLYESTKKAVQDATE